MTHPWLLQLDEDFLKDSDSFESEQPLLPDWLEDVLPWNSVASANYLEDARFLNTDIMKPTRDSDFLDSDDEDTDGFIL